MQAAQHTSLRIEEQRLDVQLADSPDTGGKQPGEHLMHRWVVLPEAREILSPHRVGLARLERRDGRRAVLLEVEQRQFAKGISRSVHRDGDTVAEVAVHAGGEAALDDQVERVGRIAAVKDDLVVAEAATRRDRNEPPDFRLGQIPKELSAEHRD